LRYTDTFIAILRHHTSGKVIPLVVTYFPEIILLITVSQLNEMQYNRLTLETDYTKPPLDVAAISLATFWRTVNFRLAIINLQFPTQVCFLATLP